MCGGILLSNVGRSGTTVLGRDVVVRKARLSKVARIGMNFLVSMWGFGRAIAWLGNGALVCNFDCAVIDGRRGEPVVIVLLCIDAIGFCLDSGSKCSLGWRSRPVTTGFLCEKKKL